MTPQEHAQKIHDAEGALNSAVEAALREHQNGTLRVTMQLADVMREAALQPVVIVNVSQRL